MPEIRPFRALRYNVSTIGDPACVVAPPYDVIDVTERDRLLARHPANIVRLDLPREEAGDEPDDRYRRAARTLAGWRSDGTLHKDPHPSIYVYEQDVRRPRDRYAREPRSGSSRGSAWSPPDPGRACFPTSGPWPGRARTATSCCGRPASTPARWWSCTTTAGRRRGRSSIAIRAGKPDLEVVDDDGVQHRLWAVPADGESAPAVAPLLAAASAEPVTIADGHHRYETALRYRDERRMSRSCEEDPPFDYLLTLFLEATQQPLTVLPTHRLVRGLGDAAASNALLAGLDALFDVRRDVDAAELRDRFGAIGLAAGGNGRFGLWTRRGGAILTRASERHSSRSCRRVARRSGAWT